MKSTNHSRLSQRKSAPGTWILLFALAAAAAGGGCSVKKFAVNKIGDALADSGTTFAADDDPDLIRDAVPFSLKMIEALLAESPRHRGLLLAGASGFTQYSYAFVQMEADELEATDLARATALRQRARRLYLRARDYGLRGLETRHPGFADTLRENPQAAVRAATKEDVPLLYWTAVAWGAAIALSKDTPDLVADQLQVEALADRSLALNEKFADGSIHGFLISYEPARQGGSGDSAARARRHFERVTELTKGQLASPYVALAESVAVSSQNRAEFESLLQKALAVDVNARPEWRLANLIMQRRARWLLSRADELFLE